MNTQADGVRRGAVVNLLTRSANLGLLLAITALVARIGPAAQGIFMLFTSVEGLMLALFSGFGVVLARRLSHHQDASRGWLTAMVMACVLLGTLAAAVLAAWAAWGPSAYASLWLLVPVAPLLLLPANLQGWWLGRGQMTPMAKATLAAPLLAAVAFVALAAASALTLPTALASWVVAKAVVAVALMAVFVKARRFAAPDAPALWADGRFIATIGVTNLIGLLNYRVGLFMVERLLGLDATGVYSIAVVAAELLWFVSGSLTQAVYSRIGSPDAAQSAALTLRAARVAVLGLAVCAPLVALVAQGVVPMLLGEAYRPALLPLVLLLPGTLLFGAASAFSAYFTNHAGRPQVPAQVALLSLLANALACAWLVPLWGLAGAAVAASVAYGMSVAVLAWRFAKAAGWPVGQLWRAVPPGGAGRDTAER